VHAAERAPIDCLADNVYYEAAHEPRAGKVAVAQVTMNRAQDYDGDVCAAVYEKAINARTGKKEAAFSWTLGARWRPHGMDRRAYAECLEISQAMLAGELQSPIGPDVKFYHATYVHPPWRGMIRVAQIGKHIFYRRPR
jgi:spore germination cell wall hydrolase CwlJ-like protein